MIENNERNERNNERNERNNERNESDWGTAWYGDRMQKTLKDFHERQMSKLSEIIGEFIDKEFNKGTGK
jgi:hypothetical protein